MRRMVVVIVIAAVAATIWIGTFPTKAECRASGRVVDPTERHCEGAVGYEQLQEHVWFHASEVLIGAIVLVAIIYAGRRLYQRRRSRDVPHAA